jgi:hypothetical protein
MISIILGGGRELWDRTFSFRPLCWQGEIGQLVSEHTYAGQPALTPSADPPVPAYSSANDTPDDCNRAGDTRRAIRFKFARRLMNYEAFP